MFQVCQSQNENPLRSFKLVIWYRDFIDVKIKINSKRKTGKVKIHITNTTKIFSSVRHVSWLLDLIRIVPKYSCNCRRFLSFANENWNSTLISSKIRKLCNEQSISENKHFHTIKENRYRRRRNQNNIAAKMYYYLMRPKCKEWSHKNK